MTPPVIEAFLARLYTDDALRAAFIAAPEQVAANAGFDGATLQALAATDIDGLVLAAASFAHKRAAHAAARRRRGLLPQLRAWLHGLRPGR